MPPRARTRESGVCPVSPKLNVDGYTRLRTRAFFWLRLRTYCNLGGLTSNHVCLSTHNQRRCGSTDQLLATTSVSPSPRLAYNTPSGSPFVSTSLVVQKRNRKQLRRVMSPASTKANVQDLHNSVDLSGKRIFVRVRAAARACLLLIDV